MYPHTFYLEKAKQASLEYENPKILKTDCDNEAYGKPTYGGIALHIRGDVTCLEYNQDVINLATDQIPGLKVVKGDIRSMPFADEEFDLVIDPSTLDHIPEFDVPRAISEYHRVTKDGLLLITWFSRSEEIREKMYGRKHRWDSHNQYYFDETTVTNEIEKKFTILEKDLEFFIRKDGYLGYFLCKKK